MCLPHFPALWGYCLKHVGAAIVSASLPNTAAKNFSFGLAEKTQPILTALIYPVPGSVTYSDRILQYAVRKNKPLHIRQITHATTSSIDVATTSSIDVARNASAFGSRYSLIAAVLPIKTHNCQTAMSEFLRIHGSTENTLMTFPTTKKSAISVISTAVLLFIGAVVVRQWGANKAEGKRTTTSVVTSPSGGNVIGGCGGSSNISSSSNIFAVSFRPNIK
jgi:hypothetical protein